MACEAPACSSSLASSELCSLESNRLGGTWRAECEATGRKNNGFWKLPWKHKNPFFCTNAFPLLSAAEAEPLEIREPLSLSRPWWVYSAPFRSCGRGPEEVPRGGSPRRLEKRQRLGCGFELSPPRRPHLRGLSLFPGGKAGPQRAPGFLPSAGQGLVAGGSCSPRGPFHPRAGRAPRPLLRPPDPRGARSLSPATAAPGSRPAEGGEEGILPLSTTPHAFPSPPRTLAGGGGGLLRGSWVPRSFPF